jgi:hypothetical protein
MNNEVVFSTFGELISSPETIRTETSNFVASFVQGLPVISPETIRTEVENIMQTMDLSSFVMKDGRKITKALWGAITRRLQIIGGISRESRIFESFCNFVRKFYLPVDTFVVQVKDALDINVVTCSDSHSCFKSGRERSFTPFLFSKNGIKLVTINQSRFWLWELDKDIVCIFNVYGMDLTRREHKTIIAEAVRRLYDKAECTYKIVDLDSTYIYINNSRGLVISFNKECPNKIDMDSYTFTCPFCGKKTQLRNFVALDADLYSFFWRHRGYECQGRTVLLCEVCYDNGVADEFRTAEYHYCDNCGERLYEDEAYFERGNVYCENCFNEIFFYCSECGVLAYRDNGYYTWDDDVICSTCAEHYYVECEKCCGLVEDTEAHYINDRAYCPSCAENYTENNINEEPDEYIEE